MASLIPMDEMTELKDASVVSEVAAEAEAIHEEQSVAAVINQAANAGQNSVTYSRVLSNEIIKKLENLGYNVHANQHAADPSKSYTIRF